MKLLAKTSRHHAWHIRWERTCSRLIMILDARRWTILGALERFRINVPASSLGGWTAFLETAVLQNLCAPPGNDANQNLVRLPPQPPSALAPSQLVTQVACAFGKRCSAASRCVTCDDKGPTTRAGQLPGWSRGRRTESLVDLTGGVRSSRSATALAPSPVVRPSALSAWRPGLRKWHELTCGDTEVGVGEFPTRYIHSVHLRTQSSTSRHRDPPFAEGDDDEDDDRYTAHLRHCILGGARQQTRMFQ